MSATSSELTMQIKDRTHNMPCSVLEFSLWTARCKQVPDMVLSPAAIDELKPWLKKAETSWKIGWKRKKPQRKPKKEDPRQGKLF